MYSYYNLIQQNNKHTSNINWDCEDQFLSSNASAMNCRNIYSYLRCCDSNTYLSFSSSELSECHSLPQPEIAVYLFAPVSNTILVGTCDEMAT